MPDEIPAEESHDFSRVEDVKRDCRVGTVTATGLKAPRLWTPRTRCAPRRSPRSLLRSLRRPGSPENSFHSSSEPSLVRLVHSQRRPEPRPFQSTQRGFLCQRRVSEHYLHGVSLGVRTSSAGRSPRSANWSHRVTPTLTGERCRYTALLYRGSSPATLTVENASWETHQ